MDDDNELIGQVEDDNGDNKKMTMVITLTDEAGLQGVERMSVNIY